MDKPTNMQMRAEQQKWAVIGLLLLWCVALCFSTRIVAGHLPFWLLWNLFLAVVPLFWAEAFQSAQRRRWPLGATFCFVLWLLFFPNAPYILTDLIHLTTTLSAPPLWFNLALLLSFAGTGTLLGYYSLLDIHRAIETRWGTTVGWSIVVASLMLSGLGIYIGRFLRWNSWSALTNPLQVLHSLAKQFTAARDFPHPLHVTLVFGGGLVVGYLALRAFAVALRSS